MSTVEAADRIGVSDQTVRNWIDRGAIPSARRYGRNWRIPSSTVEMIRDNGIALDTTKADTTAETAEGQGA